MGDSLMLCESYILIHLVYLLVSLEHERELGTDWARTDWAWTGHDQIVSERHEYPLVLI